jgi:hypothetical protein
MKLEALEFEFADAIKKTGGVVESINVNIDIPRIEQTENSIKIYFVYVANYLPEQSYIRIGGTAIFSGSDVKEMYKKWIENKKFNGPQGEQIINSINYAAATNAIFIARIFNMPPPISPPQIKLEEVIKSGEEKTVVKAKK